MDESRKKLWMKPELTILVRNKPEEAVLAACKGSIGSTSLAVQYNNCRFNECSNYCTDQVTS